MLPLDKLPAALDQKAGAPVPNRGSHRGAGAAAEPRKSRGGSLLAIVHLLAGVAARDWLSQPLHTGAVEVSLGDKQPSSLAPLAAKREGDPG